MAVIPNCIVLPVHARSVPFLHLTILTIRPVTAAFVPVEFPVLQLRRQVII